MTRLTRTALAAFAAVGAIVAAGAVGVASAAAADPLRTPRAEITRLSTYDPRVPVAEDRTIADVRVTDTRYGSPTTWRACELFADEINEQIEEGYQDLRSGNMADARDHFQEAVNTLNEAEEAGCVLA